jgi:hypothetical protein
MTEPAQEITLEDVRARFLEAETRLGEASDAIAAIEQAAERMGVAHDGVVAAGAQLAGLASSMSEVSASLSANAIHLREGVDAIRAGDPAEIKRRIEELDAAFTAMQAVTVERFTKLDAALDERFGAVEQALATNADATASRSSSAQRESRMLWAAVMVLIVVSIALAFAR